MKVIERKKNEWNRKHRRNIRRNETKRYQFTKQSRTKKKKNFKIPISFQKLYLCNFHLLILDPPPSNAWILKAFIFILDTNC